MIRKHAFVNATARMVSMLALCGTLFVMSCDDDEKQPDPVVVNFQTSGTSITENGGPQTITLTLDKAAFKDGAISISASNGAATFVTVPTEVDITSGSTAAQFIVTPVDNGTIDGSQEITITLTGAEDGFKVGESTTLALTILDDEGAVEASFSTASGTVAEDATEPITVNILLSSAADVAGTISVSFTASDAFTTTPAATAGVITIPVAAGATSASFTVDPADNEANEDDKVVNFTITGATGGVNAGTSNQAFALTISDDDNVIAKTITELRAMYAGAPLPITENIVITGVVISSNDNITSRNVWVNDGEAGILLRFNENNLTSGVHTLGRGQTVTVSLKGSTLQEFNGTLQVGNNDLPIANATTGSVGVTNIKTITIAQLLTGQYEGQFVKIENVSFPAANGVRDLRYNDNGYGAGNNKFTDGTSTGTLRVESYAPFNTEKLPFGSGAIQGIASEFTASGSTIIQVTPLSADDIFDSNATATITPSVTSLAAFGDVNNGATSAATSFTVAGTGLTADITVSAPSNYTVSLQEAGTYAASVAVPFADANLGPISVYVKFAPTTGVNQTLAANISLTSTGAEAKTVAVTGNETGNAVSTLFFTEDFNYTTGTALSANGWTVSSGGGTNAPSVVEPGLTYTGYPSDGAKGTSLTTSGEDDYKTFTTAKSDGSVYVAFLLNVSAAQATGDYFLGISPATQTNYYSRLFAKSSGAGYVLGVKKNNETGTGYGSTVLSFNTTYVVVLKYTFNTGNTTDDVTNLFVLSSGVPATEPTAEVANYNDATKTDAASINSVSLRQGTAANTATLKIDGIRIAQDWTSLFQ